MNGGPALQWAGKTQRGRKGERGGTARRARVQRYDTYRVGTAPPVAASRQSTSVAGSSMAERLTLDQEIGGSSPPPPATYVQVKGARASLGNVACDNGVLQGGPGAPAGAGATCSRHRLGIGDRVMGLQPRPSLRPERWQIQPVVGFFTPADARFGRAKLLRSQRAKVIYRLRRAPRTVDMRREDLLP